MWTAYGGYGKGAIMEENKLIKALRMCVNKNCKERLSKGITDICPYYPEKRCQEVLMKDTLDYIEHLKEREEQPMLPGIEYIDKSTGRVLSEQEAYEYIGNHPEKVIMIEKFA